MRKITHIIVHHNGVPGRTIDDIERTHVLGFKWRDIGYHAVVHEDGSLHFGRPVEKPGAHVVGLNKNTLGVCVIGNGNVSDFSTVQYVALLQLLTMWCREYKLDHDAVLGHRETAALVPAALATKKTCPGTRVDMDGLRRTLKAVLAQGRLLTVYPGGVK